MLVDTAADSEVVWAALDPEEACAKIPSFDVDTVESVKLVVLAATAEFAMALEATASVRLVDEPAAPESAVVVLEAAAFGSVVEQAAAERIVVLEAAAFEAFEKPVTVTAVAVTMSVDCSVVVEIL